MKRITDPTFKYTPAMDTDIRKTFERVRRELEQAEQQRRENDAEARSKTIAWRKR